MGEDMIFPQVFFFLRQNKGATMFIIIWLDHVFRQWRVALKDAWMIFITGFCERTSVTHWRYISLSRIPFDTCLASIDQRTPISHLYFERKWIHIKKDFWKHKTVKTNDKIRRFGVVISNPLSTEENINMQITAFKASNKQQSSAITKHYKNMHWTMPQDLLKRFEVLKKCRNKFECTKCFLR